MSVIARAFFTFCLACTVLVMSPMATMHFANADDDGGGGGGGGGGEGGGGFDPWRPNFKRSTPTAQCTCLPLIGCSCPKTKAKPQRVAEKPARPAPSPPPPSAAAPPPKSQPRQEIVVGGLSSDARIALVRRGFAVRGERSSPLTGATITRLMAPAGESSQSAIRRAQQLAPGSTVSRNDLFRRLALNYKPAGTPCGRRCEPFQVTAWSERIGACSAGVRIGIVDTGVDLDHPSLANAQVRVKTVRSSDRQASDRDHGTAVVSLLVGQSGTEVHGLTPKAQVFAADAFHGTSDGSTADTFDLITALDWVAEQNVQAVNLSLSGPDNAFMRKAIEALIARKIPVIAAAGKPDQNNATGFPARYPNVVAVSAVDARLRPSRLSIRGDHIAFAAPGAGVVVANSGGTIKLADGTSFAAPFVTAAFAAMAKSGATPGTIEQLASAAKDLGAAGRDPIYGWGLVQYDRIETCR